MAKKNGFANFTPKQDQAFIKEQKACQPQDPYSGSKKPESRQ